MSEYDSSDPWRTSKTRDLRPDDSKFRARYPCSDSPMDLCRNNSIGVMEILSTSSLAIGRTDTRSSATRTDVDNTMKSITISKRETPPATTNTKDSPCSTHDMLRHGNINSNWTLEIATDSSMGAA